MTGPRRLAPRLGRADLIVRRWAPPPNPLEITASPSAAAMVLSWVLMALWRQQIVLWRSAPAVRRRIISPSPSVLLLPPAASRPRRLVRAPRRPGILVLHSA